MTALSAPPVDKRRRFWGRFARRFPEARLALIYILPAFVVMAFITFYPILYQLWLSLTDFQLKHLRSMNPDFVGLDNFIRVMVEGLPVTNYDFGRILVFNLVWTAINVFLHVTLGILIAMAINTKDLPGRRLYRTLFVIPWALPSLISGMMWANMWHDKFGAINLLLQTLGFEGNIRWLLETDPIVNLPQIGLVLPLSFVAVLTANVWLGWPFMMVIATGALQSIPNDLYEAADVDGATGWQKLKIAVSNRWASEHNRSCPRQDIFLCRLAWHLPLMQ